VETLGEAQGVRQLIGRCLAGDRDAAKNFQQSYGEIIYGFPMRAYRTPPEDAGDFYVFAFDGGRIFRRLRTYEGRAPFRAYLLGSVLDHLVLEWKRGQHEIDTVSLDDVPEPCDDAPAEGEYVADGARLSGSHLPAPDSHLPSPDEQGDGNEDGMDRELLKELLYTLEPAKTVVLKLLYVEDYEFEPPEIRHIAEASGRGVADVIAALDRLRATVREREATARGLEDQLDAVQAWIELYERRLGRIADDLASLPPTSTAATRLHEEQSELERKVQRRHEQRAKLLERHKRRKLTAPYKEIAALLNTTVGNVGSQIARLRQELLARTGGSAQGPGAGGAND
jgi:RNA polymerase sigma factor (sigma-70 family)